MFPLCGHNQCSEFTVYGNLTFAFIRPSYLFADEIAVESDRCRGNGNYFANSMSGRSLSVKLTVSLCPAPPRTISFKNYFDLTPAFATAFSEAPVPQDKLHLHRGVFDVPFRCGNLRHDANPVIKIAIELCEIRYTTRAPVNVHQQLRMTGESRNSPTRWFLPRVAVRCKRAIDEIFGAIWRLTNGTPSLLCRDDGETSWLLFAKLRECAWAESDLCGAGRLRRHHRRIGCSGCSDYGPHEWCQWLLVTSADFLLVIHFPLIRFYIGSYPRAFAYTRTSSQIPYSNKTFFTEKNNHS